jgi:linearmycin/streptolysin S transport system permease protein
VIALVRVTIRRTVGDRRVLALATVLPLLLILVTGLLAGSPKEPVGLVNPSARLLELVRHTEGIKVRIEPDRAALTDDILRGWVVAGLVGRAAARGTLRVDFIAESATTDAVQARTDVVALLDLIAAEGASTHFTDTVLARTHAPAPLSPFSYVAPADLVLFMGITILVLSSGLVESRRLGILRRLTAAPLRQGAIVAAHLLSLLCLAAAQSVGLLVLGRILFGVHWGDPLAVGTVVALLALGLSGASVLVGLWARTQEQAIGAAVVIALAAGMLGGCVYPLDVVDGTVRSVGHAVPQAWAMDAFIRLIYHHAGFTAVLPEIGALAAFAVVLCALSTRLSTRLIRQGQG